MTQNKITPLQQLRQEKEIARREVAESEQRLAGHWNYLNDNVGTLLFTSAVNTALRKMGLKHSPDKHEVERTTEKAHSPGIFKSVLGGIVTASPLIWELVQPMVMNFAMKKIKSIFSRKKRK